MERNGLIAAVAAAAGLGDKPDQKVDVTAEFVTAHFPATAKALQEQGAVAERKRIAGIDEASLPGYEKLIAEHKADGSKTAADAALAVIAAEKTAGKTRAKALDDDEAKLKGLKSTSTDTVPAKDGEPKLDLAAALAVSKKAKAYITKEAAKGNTVNAEDAVKHILGKGEQ